MIAPLTPGLLGSSGTAAEAPSKSSEIADAAAQFEGVFMSMLVEEMFKGTDLAGGQPIYAGMITRHMGEALADAGGMGLAAIITRQLDGPQRVPDAESGNA